MGVLSERVLMALVWPHVVVHVPSENEPPVFFEINTDNRSAKMINIGSTNGERGSLLCAFEFIKVLE